MEDDNLSSASFVSSISAGSIHQPKPPDGPKPSSQGFRAKRSGKIIRSPYLATSTPYPSSKKKHHRLVNGTTGGLHHELDDTRNQMAVNSSAKQRWAKAVTATGGSSIARTSMYLPHPSASVFLQSLMKAPSFSAVVASKKRKRTQSASIGSRRNAAPSVVGSDGKDAIALRDELVELKKSLNSVSRERDLTQARYAKLEQALAKKDKEIEDLLASGHITSRDATRSLASSSSTTNKQHRPSSTSSSASPGSGGGGGTALTASGSGAVIASLRGKIHSLERALREKESALGSLKREVNATRLREMEIQCETYYREITRLTQLLADQAAPPAPGSPLSHREAQLKLKALNQATVKLASQLEQRETENKRLKQQLEKFHSESRTGGEAISHNEQGLRGSIADRYVDHKRSELLSTIVDLELRLQEKEGTLESVCGEMQEKKAHYERRIGELSGKHNDANNRIKLLEGRLTEMDTSQQKLRNIIRKLKDDRTHYRTVAEDTQSELQVIHDKLEKEGISKNDIIQELEALREKHQNEILARDHARKLSKHWSQLLMTPEKERREVAALTIQQQWRKRHAIRRQTKFQEATEQGILDIQSALRGHITRRKTLSSQPSSQDTTHSLHTSEGGHGGSVEMSSDVSDSESSDTCVAVERIQAALRGHVARQMALHDLGRLSGETDSQGNGVHLRGDSHSASSVTELWQAKRPTSSRTDPQMNAAIVETGYYPLSRVRQSLNGSATNREHIKPQYQRKLGGPVQVPSPWHLYSSPESSGDDTQPGEDTKVDRGLLLLAPSPHPETSSSSYAESNMYIPNPEQTLLADELT